MADLNFKSRGAPRSPPVERALDEPNGLLAAGGDLSPEWLLAAYTGGIFPWFNDDAEPVLWWSPDPRAVVHPDQVHISRSLAKRLRNGGFHVTFDQAFEQVIRACAGVRRTRQGAAGGTWITGRMIRGYQSLHQMGYAHSVEVWSKPVAGERQLAGGLYGVSLGHLFFGESMFSHAPDASKIALCYLARQLSAWGFPLIDCQVINPHLRSLGAQELSRARFMEFVRDNEMAATRKGPWTLELDKSEDWQTQRGDTSR